MEEFERELKVVILGDGGVGKTSLVRRFATGIFTDSYKKTIGVDFLERMLYLPALGEEARLMLWDTAGQEEFDTLTRAYYRGAACAVLAFSTVDRKSFFAVRSWRAKLAAECGNSLPTVLVQTKVDLMGSVEDGGEEGEDGKRIVGPDEAEGLAEQLGLRFHRISTKENLGVDSVFRDLATLAINAQDAAPVMASAAPREISVAEIGQIGGGQQQQQQQRQPPQAKRPSQTYSHENLTSLGDDQPQDRPERDGADGGGDLRQRSAREPGLLEEDGAAGYNDGGRAGGSGYTTAPPSCSVDVPGQEQETASTPKRIGGKRRGKVGIVGGAVNVPSTVTLVPTKRRTNGKKHLRDRLKCTIS